MAEYRHLRRRRDGMVEYLELNRPDVRNAFNDELIAELMAWTSAVAADEDVRAAVLSGAGPSFCAGADLAWMAKVADYPREQNLRDAAATAEAFKALDLLPVPLIARVHGAAFGGGLGLIALSDIVVAESGAIFSLSEVKLGLIPSTIGPYVLAKIGQSAARELFLTGRRFDAQRAKEIGLVHAVVGADQLDATVRSFLDEILASGPEAVRAAKVLIRDISRHSAAELPALTARALAERRASPEAQRLIRAFLEKRTNRS